MIQLKKNTAGGVELTDRRQAATLVDASIKLVEQTINEPGEYEANGIEVVFGTSAALVVWERLQIAYIFTAGKPSQFERAQFTPCNVVVLSESIAELTKTSLDEIVESYDPTVVIVNNAIKLEEKAKDSLKFQETNVVKLSIQTMPTEGREFYLLG